MNRNTTGHFTRGSLARTKRWPRLLSRWSAPIVSVSLWFMLVGCGATEKPVDLSCNAGAPKSCCNIGIEYECMGNAGGPICAIHPALSHPPAAGQRAALRDVVRGDGPMRVLSPIGRRPTLYGATGDARRWRWSASSSPRRTGAPADRTPPAQFWLSPPP